MVDGRYGMSGWKEFHRNRLDIIAEVDRVKELTENRPVKTAHGDAAEAQIRKWLSEFLPKKYAVTSGYIVPNLYNDANKLYHYDIIIYDSLNAPVLWVEGNSDNSEQGRHRAIPAKYVVAIYEVKSTLSVKTVKDVIKKLSELNSFSSQLPTTFGSAAIFVDLPTTDIKNKKILPTLLNTSTLYRFWGGVILRCEVDETATGQIHFFTQETPESSESIHGKPSPLCIPLDEVKMLISEDGTRTKLMTSGAGARFMSDGVNRWHVTKTYNPRYFNDEIGVSIDWSRTGFAAFAMEILRTLEGLPQDSQNAPCFGQVFDTLEIERAVFQNEYPREGEPHITIGILKDDDGNFLKVEQAKDETLISFTITAENSGNIELKLSEDNFKNTLTLPVGITAKLTQQLKTIGESENPEPIPDDKLQKLLTGENPIQFKKRFIYRALDSLGNEQDYCAACSVQLSQKKIEILIFP